MTDAADIRVYDPLKEHAAPPDDAKHRLALRLIAGMYEERGDTRVAFVDDLVVLAWTGGDDDVLELAITNLDEMIEFWTDYLRSMAEPERFADFLKDPET